MRFFYPIFFIVLFYIMAIITRFFYRFVASLTSEERSARSIGHNHSIRRRTRIQMNDGLKGFNWWIK